MVLTDHVVLLRPQLYGAALREDEHRWAGYDDGRFNVSFTNVSRWEVILREHRHDALECVYGWHAARDSFLPRPGRPPMPPIDPQVLWR